MPVTALVLPVSGAYTGTWNSVSLGTQNDDGFVLMGSYVGQEVNQSDAFGMTLVEAIHRGINWRMRFRGLEFNRPGMLNAIQAYGSAVNIRTTFNPILAQIGNRASAFAQPLVLTSIIGTDPPTMPNTLTANGAIVAPNSNVEYLMTSKVREAPFEMIFIPFRVASAAVGTPANLSFTTT